MQRSEPGVEKDQAGADRDRQQMIQRAYGQIQVGEYSTDMQAEAFGLCQGLGPGWRVNMGPGFFLLAQHHCGFFSWHSITVTRLPPGTSRTGRRASGYCGHSGLGA